MPVGERQSEGRFEAETIEVVTLARRAYSRIIEQRCPGSKAVSAVSEAFGIHRKLAWQLIKVAYAEDPFVAAKHMPSSKGIEAWAAAAESCGVGGALLESIRTTGDRFQALIATHAADKAEFEMLIESSSASGDPHAEERWRQASFDGNSFTWGARCKVLLGLTVLAPSEDRDRYFHAAQVRGLIGFRQTRQDVRWVVNQSAAVDDETRHESAMRRAPLDAAAAAAHNGVPVLPEFCSNPMPDLERTRTHDGLMQDEFVSSEVGLRGERTLVTGEVLRNIAPVHATPNDKTAHFGVAVRTPAEMLHFDLFVRAGLFGNVERELRAFSDIASSISFRDADALRVSDRISRLGRGVALAQAPDLPGYQDLALSVFSRMGLDPSEYELYRVRMAYPPVPTSVMMKHELLPPEGGGS